MLTKKGYIAVSGGFDPIHRGHIEYIDSALEIANYIGEILLLILTRDDQLIQKKKYCFMPFEEREYILRRIFPTVVVVKNIDKDLTSKKSLRFWKPTHFLKGGNSWDEENLPELGICRELEIKIMWGVGGFHKEFSSSDLVEKAMKCLSFQ